MRVRISWLTIAWNFLFNNVTIGAVCPPSLWGGGGGLGYGLVPGKLMRLDRGLLEIQSKSYSNWLLIDFCDSNYVQASIEIVATIRIRTEKVQLYQKFVNFDQKSVDFIEKVDFFNEINGPFSIK